MRTWPASNYQRWRRLLFLHWRVPLEGLRPLVPRSMEIDCFDGAAYVGLIAFEVAELRAPIGPRPLRLRFLETNVRTYVRLPQGEPGVYFFSLDAASLLAVLGARIGVGLPYLWAAGREHETSNGTSYQLIRRSARGPSIAVTYQPGEALGSAAPGGLEHFLVERYALHVQRGPTLWSVRVQHPPYPLQRARLISLHENLVAAAGLTQPLAAPDHIVFASGVDVAVSYPRIRRVP